MKKNLEKVFGCASIVVAIILIMILLVTAFGGIKTDEFQTNLVQGLLITLAILYVVLAAITMVLMFVSSDVVKEITVHSEQKGSVRISVAVISKMVKNACAEVEGAKCKKVTVVTDEYGVRLKLNIKVVDKDVIEVETYIRTLLEDLFWGEFGFRFNSIEIKVVFLAPKYKADSEKIQASVAARLEQLRQEQIQYEEKLAEEAAATKPVADGEDADTDESDGVSEDTVDMEDDAEAVGEEAAEADEISQIEEDAEGVSDDESDVEAEGEAVDEDEAEADDKE